MFLITKPFHDEICAKGGKSRSDRKLEACRRNLELAKAAQAKAKKQKTLSIMSRTEPPPAAYAETTRPVAFSVNIIVPVAGFEGSRFIKAGEPSPYCDISEVPEQLKGFIAGDEDAESQGPPGGLFELTTIYNVSPEGAILSRAGRRAAAQLAGEASWQAQAEEEAIAAGTLDPETECSKNMISASAWRLRPPRSGRAMPTRLSRRRRPKRPALSKSPRLFTSSAAAPGCTPSGPGSARANRSL